MFMIVFEAADHFLSPLHSLFAGNIVAFAREEPPNVDYVPIIADGVVGSLTEMGVVVGIRRTLAEYSLA